MAFTTAAISSDVCSSILIIGSTKSVPGSNSWVCFGLDSSAIENTSFHLLALSAALAKTLFHAAEAFIISPIN